MIGTIFNLIWLALILWFTYRVIVGYFSIVQHTAEIAEKVDSIEHELRMARHRKED